MNIEDLTPDERNEVQAHLVRAFFARKRRREFGELKARIKRYDVGGRLIGVGSQAVAPRMTSRQEDRSSDPDALLT